MKNILKIILIAIVLPSLIISKSFSQVYVTWEERSLNGVNLSVNTLTKFTDPAWGNAGASSLNVLPGPENGYMQFKITSLNNLNAYGLSDVNANDDYTSIDYAVLINYDQVYVYHNGRLAGEFGLAHLNDIFKIEKKDTLILFKKNGIRFYEMEMEVEYQNGSLVPSALPDLIVDVCLHDQYTSLNEVKCNFDATNVDISASVINESKDSPGNITISSSIAGQYQTIWNEMAYPSAEEFEVTIYSDPIFENITETEELFFVLEEQRHQAYLGNLKASPNYKLSLMNDAGAFDYDVIVGTNLEWRNSSGMYFSLEPFPNILNEDRIAVHGDGVTLRKTGGSGYEEGYAASVNCFRTNSYWSLQFIIPDLTQNSKIGFKENYSSLPFEEELQYGFESTDGYLRYFFNGESTDAEFQAGDLFTIQHFYDEGTSSEQFIYLRNEEVLLDQIIDASVSELYLNVAIDQTGAAIEKIFAICDNAAPLFSIESGSVDIINSTGSIALTPVYTNSVFSEFTYEWYNIDNEVLSNSDILDGVEAGIYYVNISYTLDGSPVNETKEIPLKSKVFWTDPVYAEISDEVNGVFASTTGDYWNSGVTSVNLLRETQDGFVELTLENLNRNLFFGFSNVESHANYTWMDHGFLLFNGELFIYERGGLRKYIKGIANHSKLTIKKAASEIIYMVNDAEVYVSMYSLDDKKVNFKAGCLTNDGDPLSGFLSNISVKPFSGDFTIGESYANVSELIDALNGTHLRDTLFIRINGGQHDEKLNLGESVKYASTDVNYPIYVINQTDQLATFIYDDKPLEINEKENILITGCSFKSDNGDGLQIMRAKNIQLINCEIIDQNHGVIAGVIENSDNVNFDFLKIENFNIGITGRGTCFNNVITNSSIKATTIVLNAETQSALKIVNNRFEQTTSAITQDIITITQTKDTSKISGNIIIGKGQGINISQSEGNLDLINNKFISSENKAIFIKAFKDTLNIISNEVDGQFIDHDTIKPFPGDTLNRLPVSSGIGIKIKDETTEADIYDADPGKSLNIFSNNIYRCNNAVELNGITKSDIILLNNKIGSCNNGIVASDSPGDNNNSIKAIGNLICNNDFGLKFKNNQAKILAQSNTIISGNLRNVKVEKFTNGSLLRKDSILILTPDTLAKCIDLFNCSDFDGNANNVINLINANMILANQVPASLDLSWNNWYSYQAQSLNNSSIISSGTDNYFNDPRFGNFTQFYLSSLSQLLDQPVIYKDTLSQFDLNGVYRNTLSDIGAFEYEGASMSNFPIEVVLEKGIVLYPDLPDVNHTSSGLHPSSECPACKRFNKLLIRGLENFSSYDLKIYNRNSALIYETQNPNEYWNGSYSFNNELVEEGSYKFILTLNNNSIGGFVYVKR